MNHQDSEISLSKYQWEWKDIAERSPPFKDEWRKCIAFPTVIHHELEQAKLIDNPFIADNERKIQWVGEKDWAFRTAFPTPRDALSAENVLMAFDGLDTFAKVQLNGKVILESDNMFVPHRVCVKSVLKPEGMENELLIAFKSAWNVGKELEAKYGKRRSIVRDSSRLYVRKAQYHWGWDWGPMEITAGPYKDIRLEIFDSRISGVWVRSKLSEDLETATVSVQVSLESCVEDSSVHVAIKGPGESGTLVEQTLEPNLGEVVNFEFVLSHVQLWWPAGHGEHPMYKAITILKRKDVVVHRQETAFGIRDIQLVQRPFKTAPGKTFMFVVNKRPIYICGTNWVPMHNQSPKMSSSNYRKWVDLAVRNNNNMIRVWGGGIYEDEAFYSACDERGIMVWQDLMTACGSYPVEDFFLESVKKEAEAQAVRLRKHPCFAIWCGNNEDFMIADARGDKYDPTDITGPWHDTAMPQRIIYMKIWPEVLKKFMPDMSYWPSSPWGGSSANDPTEGDVHQWNVWHHKQLPYQQFPQLGGRLVSEFGMHGFPDIRTVEVFAPDAESRYPNSRVMDTHNKSRGAENKMGRYLWENFKLPTSMESFIYLSQLMQAEALDHAIIHWRRQFHGEGEELNMGSIVWQLNDSNPTTSWSLVDYYFRPKAAFYTTKRAFAQISVGISRSPVWHFLDENEPLVTNIPTFQVWGSTFALTSREVEVRLRMYDLTTQKELELGENAAKRFTLRPNCSTELLTLNSPPVVQQESLVILSAALYDVKEGTELARKVSWPEPYRYLDLPSDAGLEVRAKDENTVVLSCGAFPLKGVMAYVDPKDGEEPEWADNMHDLMPGEEIVLEVHGLDNRKVHVRHLGSIY